VAKAAKDVFHLLNHNQATHNGPIPNIAYGCGERARSAIYFAASINVAYAGVLGLNYSTVMVTISECIGGL